MQSRIRRVARSYQGLDRRIWTLAAVRGINTMGLSLVLSFMGIYLVTERGVSGVAFGAIYFVANVCQAATNTYAGALSDRLGRRRLMVWALLARVSIIALLGALVLAHAPIPVLAVVLIASASLRGGFEPVAYAVVADLATPPQRIPAFALQRVGINVGWAIGPALGGVLSSIVDYGLVFFCSVVPLFFSALAIARMAEPAPPAAVDHPEDRRVSMRAALAEARARGELLLLLACALVFAIVQVQLFSTLSLYAKSELGLANGEIGLLYTINGVLVVVLQIPALALIARLTADRALVAGCAIYTVALLAIGLADAHTIGLAVALATMGEVVLAPAQQATVAELADAGHLGRAFGLFGTMQMLGVALALPVGGVVYDHLRHRPLAMWGVLAALAGILVLGYARFGVLHRRRTATSDKTSG